MIRPVPADLVESDGNVDGAHHIVYKRQTDPMDQLSDFGKSIDQCQNQAGSSIYEQNNIEISH